MTAKNVSVGLTYEVMVSDKLVPVTLVKDCPYGGWYGRNNVTGHTVRIKTAGRLRKQLTGEVAAPAEAAKQDATTTQVHTTTMEATVPTTTRSAAKNARAARRAKSAPSITLTPTEEVTVSNTTRKPRTPAGTTPRNANGTIKAKPKPAGTVKLTAKPKAKPVAKAKPAAKRAAKPAPKLDAAPTPMDIDAIVAAAVAEALAKAAPAAKVTRSAKPKPVAAKPVSVTLKPGDAKVNSYSFKYAGKDDKPLVTAVYIMIPLLERFAEDGSPVNVEFRPYVQSGKGKPMPKSKIRYSGSDDTIRDLYVDRAAITKLGYSESKPPVVTVEVGKGNVVILTFQPA